MHGITWNAKINGIQKTFKNIAVDILDKGMISKPRNFQTRQCIGATIILDPKDTMIRNKRRNMNYVFSLIQKLVYTSGKAFDSGILEWYNSNYKYYQDGIDIGNYGWRIAIQLRQVIQTLCKDADTRQAIISIYNPFIDQRRQTVDIPCTLNLQFLIRNNKLDMIVSMRSNDLLWGFSYDINQFAYIQKLIAMIMGVQTGTYIHHSNSLHIYEHSYQTFEKIIKCNQLVDEYKQSDLSPRYNDYAPQERLTSYLKDCNNFWLRELYNRTNPENFPQVVKFKDDSTFFAWRCQKTNKYSLNKSQQFKKDYLSGVNFRTSKKYSIKP